MLKELEEMSKGQKLYNYECKSCGFEKGVPEFILEELRQDAFFSLGAIASLNEKNMPELICPNCGAKFEYKKLTTVRCQLKVLSQEHLLKVFCGSIFYATFKNSSCFSKGVNTPNFLCNLELL